jgi:hypothetical protein
MRMLCTIRHIRPQLCMCMCGLTLGSAAINDQTYNYQVVTHSCMSYILTVWMCVLCCGLWFATVLHHALSWFGQCAPHAMWSFTSARELRLQREWSYTQYSHMQNRSGNLPRKKYKYLYISTTTLHTRNRGRCRALCSDT